MADQSRNDGGLRELALFAGAGGGILGGKLLGWRTVCAVERDAYAAQVLAQRQNDGILEPFPIWSDVESFDGKPWRGIVDVISGGFPCQDISVAGKGAGITGGRSGLWSEMARIIGEVRPRFAFIENSPALVNRGLDTVLSDLASMGLDAEWGVLSAADVGAPHLRERIWILAYSELHRVSQRRGTPPAIQESQGRERVSGYVGQSMQQQAKEILADSYRVDRFEVWRSAQWENRHFGEQIGGDGGPKHHLDWPGEPDVERVVDGVPFRLDRNKALGNGQVPRVAATAFRLLAERAGL